MRRPMSPSYPRMIVRDVKLTFDDNAGELQVDTHDVGAAPDQDEVVPHPFTVRYDDISEVILETTSLANGKPAHWIHFAHKPVPRRSSYWFRGKA